MEEIIYKELSKEQKTKFHGDLLTHCKGLVDSSRNVMQRYYSKWKKYDEVFRAHMPADRDDKNAQVRKEPKKAVVPVTLSVVSTFTAFAYAVLTQRPTFYELVSTKEESDGDGRFLAEALLERDLEVSKFHGLVLVKLLQNYANLGLCIVRHGWRTDYGRRQVRKEVESTMFGMFKQMFQSEVPTEVVEEEYVRREGNDINHISPYRFFPDTRVPLERFQEGEFVATEYEMGYIPAKKAEARQELAGVKHVTTLPRNLFSSTHADSNRLYSAVKSLKLQPRLVGTESSLPLLITEVEIELIPNEWSLSGSKVLGEEDYPVKFLVKIANDNRIVAVERMNYTHEKFTFDVAEFVSDQNHYIGFGVSEIIEDLQNTISWFINSRITSVRKVIQNQLIIDPTGVNMEDVKNRRPVIRLLHNASGQDVRKFVNQLQLQDVTQAHLTDVNYLTELVYEVTGISRNMIGQYATGRRSARESASVNINASNRASLYVRTIWDVLLRPLGQKMLENLRTGLSVEQYVKAVGAQAAMSEGTVSLFAVRPEDISGNYEFQTYDGTLPSERAEKAHALAELLEVMLRAPELIQAYQIDVWQLIREWAILRGIRHPDRFRVREQPQQGGTDGSGAQPGLPGQQPQFVEGGSQEPTGLLPIA